MKRFCCLPRPLFFLLFLLAALAPAIAQTQTTSPEAAPAAPQTQVTPPAAAAAPAKGLTVEDVIKLSQAGLSDNVIIGKIKKNGQAFDLSPDQLLQLKTARVNDKVIEVMMDPSKADAALTPAPATVTSAASADPSIPNEVGVYARKQGEKTWNEVPPEVVNWKTGGVMKSIATYGVVKGDVNGHIEGKSSQTAASTTTEFLIVASEGVSLNEYQLLHLHQNGNNREFRTVTGGVFHASGGATRDVMKFDGKKTSPRHYFVMLPAEVKKGEYAFMPPGAVASTNAAGSTGKVYSFRVIE
jgi:hypothetical protein